jgi:hypothetical protein
MLLARQEVLRGQAGDGAALGSEHPRDMPRLAGGMMLGFVGRSGPPAQAMLAQKPF